MPSEEDVHVADLRIFPAQALLRSGFRAEDDKKGSGAESQLAN
jgi:transcription termination factor Rho